MSLLEETKSLLRHNGIRPKRSLSQNFMIESSIHRLMAEYASLGKNDTVLDVGAGLGFLTRFLSAECRVIAVERDSRLCSILHSQLKNVSSVEIVEGDALAVDLPSFNKVVAIPPYHISSSLITWLYKMAFDCAVLVLQNEFASRMTASIRSENYGWLRVLTYYYSEVELLDLVPKWMFYPPPKVDSVIVRLKPKTIRPFKLKNEIEFQRLLQSLFTQRNKKVRGAVLQYLRAFQHLPKQEAAKIAQTTPFQDKRVREIAPEDFGVLFDALSD